MRPATMSTRQPTFAHCSWCCTCSTWAGVSSAALIVSRLFAGTFWYIARNDLVFTPYIEGWNHAAWGILGAYAVHLIVGADFAYYYIKTVLTQGLANMGTLVCEEV